MTNPTLTVVIPAYNEQDYIQACLDALIAQISDIDEIIVVDNNSTDNTAQVVHEAQSRSDKIRLLSETEPGVPYALYAGFHAATSDLIARIDADTFVSAGWAAAIKAFFIKFPDYSAGTGLATMHDMPFQGFFVRLQRPIRERIASKFEAGECLDTSGVVGFNGVITSKIWAEISSRVSYRRDIHENTDMSLCILEQGGKIGVVPGMNAKISGRRYLSTPWSYFKYASCEPNAFKLHKKRAGFVATWAAVFVGSAFQTLIWIPARSYNPTTGRFSVKQLFTPEADRTLPVSVRAHDLHDTGRDEER
ncbi:glycosyltransferase family A protein [Prescottella subtropica]|uniref:glycosyltransferase family A protein n=1 Tax=Prescottella subtropica TaxID=2545757 RepID=UPI0010F54330|nr:glycosyltransferase family 2 protein [Prescottella subtropica]